MLITLKKEVPMIKKMFFAMLAISMAACMAGCSKDDDTTDDPPVDTTQHDNWVYLNPFLDNPAISYSETAHDITSGQPWGGMSSGMSGGVFGIDVKAGRHNSSGPANWFHSNCSNATCCNWPSGCNPWPSDLNFAFTGTITINGTNYSITLGQGSDGVHNNWWVGGPGWTAWSSPFGDAVVTPDGKYYFEPADDTFNQFNIRLKP